MEYILKTIKLEPSEKHDLYVQSLKANKFDSVTLPDYLPPLANKQQVFGKKIINFVFNFLLRVRLETL